MLVLQIGEIERYAGSLIISARNNPRGVPAIEKIMVASPQMSFPGIEEDQRLARIQERVILECVMQLLIEHGICLQHEGLLIFPSLFQPTEKDKAPAIPHSISLYYDFSGAIDNIYSSLVAWLGISGYFGRPRLWDDRAEFEMIGQGACGLRKIDRGGGFAHLDIYFEDKTPEDIRNIFINFVEEHLHEYGIEICETIEITCSCSFSFSEASPGPTPKIKFSFITPRADFHIRRRSSLLRVLSKLASEIPSIDDCTFLFVLAIPTDKTARIKTTMNTIHFDTLL